MRAKSQEYEYFIFNLTLNVRYQCTKAQRRERHLWEQAEDHFDEQGHKVTRCLLLDFLRKKDLKQDVNNTNEAIF